MSTLKISSISALAGFLMLASPVQSAPGDMLCLSKEVLVTGVMVREKPDDGSPVKMVIGTGRKMIEFGNEGAWTLVGVDNSGGLDGWVKTRYLSTSDPDGLPCGS